VDPQREALGDRGLADAGLADQHGVVLAPAGEDLDRLFDLVGAPDHGIDAAARRVGRQIAAELVQGAVLGLLLAAGNLGRALLAEQRRPLLGADGEDHPHRARPPATSRAWVKNLSHDD
jgi:hypothetical protein